MNRKQRCSEAAKTKNNDDHDHSSKMRTIVQTAPDGIRFSEDIGIRLERAASVGDLSITRAIMPAVKLMANKLRQIMPLVAVTNGDGTIVRTPAVRMPLGGFVVIVANEDKVMAFGMMGIEGHKPGEVIREMIKDADRIEGPHKDWEAALSEVVRDILYGPPELVQQAYRGMLSILFRSFARAFNSDLLGLLDKLIDEDVAPALIVLAGECDDGDTGFRGPILLQLGRYAQALEYLSATEPANVH